MQELKPSKVSVIASIIILWMSNGHAISLVV